MAIAARRKQAEAKGKLEAAAEAFAEKRAIVAAQRSTQLQAAFKTVLADKTLKTEMQNAAQTLGLDDLNDSVEGFRAAAEKLNDQTLETRSTVGALLGRLKRRWSLLLCLLVVIVPIALATVLPSAIFWAFPAPKDQIGTGTSLVAGFSGMIAIATGFLSFASRQSARALATIRTFESKLEAEITKRSADKTKVYAQAEAEVNAAQKEVDRRREALSEATKLADRASLEFVSKEPKQRLVDFLRDRVGSGTYARELGIIAAVRKDFEMLSQLMASSISPNETPEARSNTESRRTIQEDVERILEETTGILEPEERTALLNLAKPPAKPPVTFERIILYIDDLDRCPPAQVIDVLQAIHLLLAFPLFIVVVAVDSRWVLKALDEQYGELLDGEGDSASAMDYLEKIIQLPYQVRNIRVTGEGSMIGDLLEPFVRSPDKDQSASPVPLSLGNDDPEVTAKSAGPAFTETNANGENQESETKFRRNLSIFPHELDLLNRIEALLDWSPRRRLRFANSYLLSRASISGLSEDDLSGLAILLACTDATDRHSAAEKLSEELSVPFPTGETLRQLSELCDRFSFSRATSGDPHS